METGLVETLARSGIRDPHVLAALMRVPREGFVPTAQRERAHDDVEVPLGHGQLMPRPSIVAAMLAALQVKPGATVLEIGTGSGYEAAVLAELGARVFTVERVPELAERAALNLARQGVRVRLRSSDGRFGWPEEAPFDRVLVTCACDILPQALLAQLASGGRLVVPLGAGEDQVLQVLSRGTSGVIRSESLMGVRFLPLLGPPH